MLHVLNEKQNSVIGTISCFCLKQIFRTYPWSVYLHTTFIIWNIMLNWFIGYEIKLELDGKLGLFCVDTECPGFNNHYVPTRTWSYYCRIVYRWLMTVHLHWQRSQMNEFWVREFKLRFRLIDWNLVKVVAKQLCNDISGCLTGTLLTPSVVP